MVWRGEGVKGRGGAGKAEFSQDIGPELCQAPGFPRFSASGDLGDTTDVVLG